MKKNYSFFKLLFMLLFALLLGVSVKAGNVTTYEFNGSSESIYITNSSGLNVTDHWTFESWIYVDTVTGWDDFMFRSGIFSFQVKNPLGSGDFAVDFYNRDNTEELTTDASGDLTYNTWYHVAATFDGTIAKLYIDGTVVDSDNTASNWILATTSYNLNIGARYSGGYGNYYNGQLDEIRISKVARSASELQTNYSREAYYVDTNTLILMHFDDGAATVTYETGSGFAGIVHMHNMGATNYQSTSIDASNLLRPAYVSKATGNWSDSTSWQYFNGSTSAWEDAVLTPDYYDDSVYVSNGDVITIDEDVSIDQTTVNTGAKLIIDDGVTATLQDGSGTDLDVWSTLEKRGSLTRSSGAEIKVENGATYQHNTAANVSTATWETGSTCEIIGVGTGTSFLELGNVGQSFYNFTWNSSSQNRNVGLQGLTTVLGDFVMSQSNDKDVRLVTTATDKSLYVHGDFILDSDTLEMTNASGDCYLICYANYTQTGGALTAPGAGTGYLRFGTLTGTGLSGYFTQTGGTFAPENIQVNKSYLLTLSSDMNTGSAPMIVIGDVTIPVGLTLTVGTSLTVKSTATNQGSLINHSTIVGDIDAECYTTAGQWHSFSTPVDNQTANALYLNGSPDVWMKSYNEADNTYTYVSDLATDLGDMMGWMIWIGGSTAQTFTFSGPGRTGTIGSNNNLVRSNPGSDYGYNFVGNPFTSAIDWDATSGWTKTNVDATIYVYNNGNFATYTPGSGSTNGGSAHIAMNQGFFVQVTDGNSNGTLEMTSDVCVHSDTAFMKSVNATSNPQKIRLEVSNGSLTDETLICLNDEATPGWDGSLDAHKLFSFNKNHPQIYSTDNGMMSINALPSTVETIPLDVKGQDGNPMTISLTEVGDIDQVHLYDNYTGESTDLKKKDYQFTYNESVADRFILSFLITDIAEKPMVDKGFYAYSTDGGINVVLKEKVSSASITVFNLLGQKITSVRTNNNETHISMLKSGYYLVRVNTGLKTGTEKVFIQ